MPDHQAVTLRSCDFKLLAAGSQGGEKPSLLLRRKGGKVTKSALRFKTFQKHREEVILVLTCP